MVPRGECVAEKNRKNGETCDELDIAEPCIIHKFSSIAESDDLQVSGAAGLPANLCQTIEMMTFSLLLEAENAAEAWQRLVRVSSYSFPDYRLD